MSIIDSWLAPGSTDYVVGNFMYDPYTAQATGTLANIVAVGGGVCWMICYALIIYRAIKDKKVIMPMFVLGLNFAWEFCYAFVYDYCIPVQRVVNALWFLLDCGLVFFKYKYCKEDFKATFPGANTKWAPWYTTGMLVAGSIVVYMSYYDFGDPQGITSAFIQNTFISAMILSQWYRAGKTIDGTSMGVALFKAFGTLAPIVLGVFYVIATGGLAELGSTMVSVQVMCAVIILCDWIYIINLYKRFKELGLNPWTRKPLAK